MSGLPTNREEAVDVFLELLIDAAYEGAIRSQTSILERGPGGPNPPERLLALHRWFSSLAEEDREMVLRVIQETADFSVFNSLVFLDGRKGGRYRYGKVLDFALYLEVYPQDRAQTGSKPELSIRLNPVDAAVDDLHDMFVEKLEKRLQGGSQ